MQAKLSAVADLKNYPGRVWKILRRMRKDSADVRTFMKSDEVSSFRSHTGPAFVLLQTPEHGNMGDHAIAFAEKKFLRDAFPEVPVYEFPFRACELRLKEIAAGTAPQDIVLITGGGFAGTIQAFVPGYLADYYADEMNSVFGENSCRILNIRSVGGTQIKI